jgi:hypothetical protein
MNIWKTAVQRTQGSAPFPHIILDNFLPEELVEQFLEGLRDADSLYGHKGWGGNRISAQFGTNEYKKLLNESEAFREIHEMLNSSDALECLYNWFAPDLRNSGLKVNYLDVSKIHYRTDKTEFGVTSNFLKRVFIKFINNPILRRFRLRRYYRSLADSISGPEIYPLISFSKSTGGYIEPLHTDFRHKIFVCLIYLDDLVEGGEFEVKKLVQERELAKCTMYPLENEAETVMSIKPKRNRCVVFLNQNNAYHATTPFEGLRRFIYFAYAASNVESAFETNYPVLLGDIGRNGTI